LVAGVAVGLVPRAGLAAPPPTLDQVRAQLAALSAQAEVAQEQLLATQVAVAAGQRALAQVNARVARSQAVVDAAGLQVGRLASAAYRAGGVDQTLELLLADSPAQFLEQMTALDSVTRHQSDVLRAAAVAQQRLGQDKLAAAQQLKALRGLYAAAAAENLRAQAAKAKVTALFNSLAASQKAALLKAQADASAAARASASHRASRGHIHWGSGSYSSGIGGRVVAYAMSKVGDSYSWGASGPNSFDCSGLTMRAYAQAGISLPHSSSAQYGSGRHISEGSLQPGDLVFYYSPIHHVGIYIGGGMIVHAANPGEGVTIAPLYSMPYDGAVRPY
jgi:cell wall-associated NlpC family hydrolase